jgi:hypothetical protein
VGSVCRIKPAISDDREQHAGLVQRFANPPTEIVPVPDGVEIEKERVATETALKVIQDPACDVGAVLTPIGEKDLGHCRRLRVTSVSSRALDWLSLPAGGVPLSFATPPTFRRVELGAPEIGSGRRGRV